MTPEQFHKYYPNLYNQIYNKMAEEKLYGFTFKTNSLVTKLSYINRFECENNVIKIIEPKCILNTFDEMQVYIPKFTIQINMN